LLVAENAAIQIFSVRSNKNRELVGRKMTPEQIGEAQRLAREREPETNSGK
jgi:hypothetical protein